MAYRNLLETDLTGNACYFSFMRRELIGMHEGNRDRLIALIFQRKECRFCFSAIKCLLDSSIGVDTLIEFGYAVIKRFRLNDLRCKDVLRS